MNIIVEAVNAFLHVFIGFVFCSAFWNSKQAPPLLFINIGYSILLTVSLLLLKGTLYLYIPMFTITFAISLMFKSKIINKILCSCLYLAINSIVEVLVSIFISTVFQTSIDVFRNYSVYHISGMLISKFIVFLIVLFIRIKKHNAFLQRFKRQYLSIFLIPLSTLVITVLQCGIFIKYPVQDMTTKIFVIISYTALIISNIIVFDFIDSLYLNTVNEGRIITANEIISNQKEQYKALIDHNREIAQIQHDNKHLFFGLISEMKKGNYEAVMTGLTGAYEICEKEIASDSIIDSIVNIKAKEAREKGINIDYEYRHLRDMKISPMDIAIMLGNALDNAIEACKDIDSKEDTTIYVYVALKGDNLVILIKNPVRDNVDVTKLASKKENAELHGFGVLSMKQIAAKYDGEVVFKCEDNVFATTIIMSNIKL